MIIGNFSYKQAEDTYTGEIKTLTLLRSSVQFRPTMRFSVAPAASYG
jgi:uncharacterized protein (DUF736 family)